MDTEFKFEDGKLYATRVYPASRELVFEAWVETSKIRQWWGCAECVSVRSEVEPKVGGKYNHHMTLEGIGEVPGHGTLLEFDPPRLLVYETALPTDPNVKMQVRVEFTEVEGGTQVQLTQSGIPDIRIEGDFELREIIQGGWTAALEKLNGLFVSGPSVPNQSTELQRSPK